MDMVALRTVKVTAPAKSPGTKARKTDVRAASLLDGMSEDGAASPGKYETARSSKKRQPESRCEAPVFEPVLFVQATRERPVLEVSPAGPPAERSQPAEPSAYRPEAGELREGPFGAALMECLCLYRDGGDFGCIALAHALCEAMIRRICRVKLGPGSAKVSDIRSQLASLCAVGALSVPLKTQVEQCWLERIGYEQLVPTQPKDREKLRMIAEGHTRLLIALVRRFFGYSITAGKVRPDHSEYWPPTQGNRATLAGIGQ